MAGASERPFSKTDNQDSVPAPSNLPYAFFFPAAFAFAAFFLLLRIITALKKEPTTAQPSRMRITGIRIAQTRGGNIFCRG